MKEKQRVSDDAAVVFQVRVIGHTSSSVETVILVGAKILGKKG